MFDDADTIAAIATADAPAAIGILRISGPQASAILSKVVPDVALRSRRVASGWALSPDTAERIDEVLCFFCRGPGTATGEDVAEIHGHGGPLVMRRLLRAALSAGARPANPGEFTYRAFANGRMDLTQAEAIMGLIGARSDRAAQVALNQLAGALGTALQHHFETLNRTAAHLEAGLDFPDEDLPLARSRELARDLGGLAADLETLRDSFSLGAKLGEGARIGIVGPPNVGKSSLFNRLVKEERAIVDADPGTTRDVIEAVGQIAGIPVVFSDTAGMRDHVSRVEKLGIERSRSVAAEADLLLLILDGARPIPEAEQRRYRKMLLSVTAPVLVVLNKNDLAGWRGELPPMLAGAWNRPVVGVSAVTGEGLDRLLESAGGMLEGDRPRDTVILTTARQHRAISETASHVRTAAAILEGDGEPELAAAELLWAREKIAALLGRSATEEMLSSLFSEFCLGK